MDEEIMSSNFIHDFIDEDLKEGVYDHVQTRFPPEPNGYLHIGHAKAICINFGTAQKYGGVCNLRLDDTNPQKEDTEYVDAIKEDIEWLGFKWNKCLYASSYFDFIYECAVKLIKDGKAYVDDLSADEIREYRGTLTEPGKNSPYRDRTTEENLDLFKRMTNGEFPNGARVLRAKIDMASPNINMRDPVIYRIAHVPHHQTGDKWCVYPMYDFAHPLSDYKEGVTHSLCSLEFENHRPKMAGLIEIDGDYYFAGGANGELAVSKVQNVWKANGISLSNPNCEFGADGKMLNGIIERDGKLYYYEMGRPKAAGLVEVDGDYYFAGGENGEILVNVKQYTWANSTSLPNGTYEFGADGKMLNGIVEKDGTLYYYEMGKTKTAGLIQIDGDYYFAGGANGEITVNKKQYVWQSNGLLPEDNYEFGADGKMLNGFVTRDDGIYYYDTGKYGRVGLNLIDGDYYFVGYYGKLYTNGTYYVWETNGYSICMNYTFDETGKLVK